MNDFVEKWAEIESTEAQLRAAMERLVDMVLRRDWIAVKAAVAVTDASQFLARSVAAALLRTDDSSRRASLVFLLETLGPSRDYETLQPLAVVADTDWDVDVREHAGRILDDLGWEEVRAEWEYRAAKTEARTTSE
jgi:hypothetical protein